MFQVLRRDDALAFAREAFRPLSSMRHQGIEDKEVKQIWGGAEGEPPGTTLEFIRKTFLPLSPAHI